MQVTITVDPKGRAGDLIAPKGFATPHSHPVGLEIQGAGAQPVDLADGQRVVILSTDGKTPLRLIYSYAEGGEDYPAEMFHPRDSRFTRAAEALVADAEALRHESDPARAIANHVAELFSYGHPETRFYEDHDHIPQLCGLTEGSCVDINAYLIASLRAAGIEAGYVTGVFFPAEKIAEDGSAWCNDMHCWVVTRCGHGVREWDIAHHLKLGEAEIKPALDPKPGFRLPLAHSMGHDIASLGLHDVKLLSEPMWVSGDRLEDAEARITFQPKAFA
jgi:hypothetical protein